MMQSGLLSAAMEATCGGGGEAQAQRVQAEESLQI